jgi:hypothetical protein
MNFEIFEKWASRLFLPCSSKIKINLNKNFYLQKQFSSKKLNVVDYRYLNKGYNYGIQILWKLGFILQNFKKSRVLFKMSSF